MSRKVVLLGNSVFDKAAYVGGGPDVAACLRGMAPSGADTTHLVVSLGGNDALGVSPARSVGEDLMQVAGVGEGFRAEI